VKTTARTAKYERFEVEILGYFLMLTGSTVVGESFTKLDKGDEVTGKGDLVGNPSKSVVLFLGRVDIIGV
jgi:hypothetical protein